MKKLSDNPHTIIRAILDENFGSLKNTVIVSGADHCRHEKELRRLTEGTRYERFFFIVDLVNQSIQLSTGIERWLGYTDEEFSLSLYMSIIHEHHLNVTVLFGKILAGITKQQQIDISLMREKFVSEIALKHIKGHYLLVRRTLSCWDFDKTCQLPTAYLNEFVVWREYEADKTSGISPRIIDSQGTRLWEVEEIIKENAYGLFEADKRFSVQELRILRKYAYNTEMNTQKIAQAFRISPNTANIYNRRIIEKFLDLYPNEKLKTAREIAQFLRNENLI